MLQVESVPTPRAGFGNVLIRVNGSSVNPSDVDTVEGGGCTNGCGADVSGTVVECVGCKRLKVGDEVWTVAEGVYMEGNDYGILDTAWLLLARSCVRAFVRSFVRAFVCSCVRVWGVRVTD